MVREGTTSGGVIGKVIEIVVPTTMVAGLLTIPVIVSAFGDWTVVVVAFVCTWVGALFLGLLASVENSPVRKLLSRIRVEGDKTVISGDKTFITGNELHIGIDPSEILDTPES